MLTSGAAMGYVNLVKLCVGAADVEDLIQWHRANESHWPDGMSVHVTRMWPRREAEIVAGGSIYWVMSGLILCRQRIIRLEPREGEDGIRRCALILDRHVHRTLPTPRRPFQGWRYLDPADSPRDLPERKGDDDLPTELAQALAEIGLR